jgi:hypothetical protein
MFFGDINANSSDGFTIVLLISVCLVGGYAAFTVSKSQVSCPAAILQTRKTS